MILTLIAFLILLLIFLSLLFYKLIFLRDPERNIPVGDSIVSPADGKIISIISLNNPKIKIKKGLLGKIRTLAPSDCKDGYLITIMMNILNVHVQRSPLEGIIMDIKHSPGTFKNAVYGDKFKNGLENEKNEILIKNKKIGSIKVIQIAGLVARRIECFVQKKQKVNKGDRIGRIMLGSQVSLILPKKARLLAKEGDKAKAGETVLAYVR
ncbi:phosphatidylserine decarboxylase [Candidatus Woesearchaeota archaeon]|nr:phosphatidylserine decarboxylase [Candidatus Woesearchaeota archaeon]